VTSTDLVPSGLDRQAVNDSPMIVPTSRAGEWGEGAWLWTAATAATAYWVADGGYDEAAR